MSKYLMCMCAYSKPSLKFLSLILWLGGLCTNTDADDTDNNIYAPRINHDYVGLFGIIPNEPKMDFLHKYLRICCTRAGCHVIGQMKKIGK